MMPDRGPTTGATCAQRDAQVLIYRHLMSFHPVASRSRTFARRGGESASSPPLVSEQHLMQALTCCVSVSLYREQPQRASPAACSEAAIRLTVPHAYKEFHHVQPPHETVLPDVLGRLHSF